MADEDITLDGKPLHSLRVADLKAALEQRNLPKSGQKNTLIKRLKGALMLENLQRSSSSHSVLQPNSQIGEEMCQNSFIKQYLAKQQELLRQRLEREAQKEDEDEESPAGPEEDDDHSEDNDSSSYVADKHRASLSKASVPDVGGGGDSVISHGPGSTFHHQESLETPRVRVQQATFQQGHKEPPAPSPPRAVASLSVRVLGQPDCQGFPLAAPRPQEKEPAGHSRPGSAHVVLNLSRSAKGSAGNHVQDDSDDDDDDDDDSDDEDEDWGPGKAGRQKRMPPSLPQAAPSMSSAAARSKRKLQPPQHIPPPQVDPTPMQLRHPTPPPSPPPNLFPLPDTPKQSPPDEQERDGLREAQVAPFQPPSMQRQDSDSSSRSSSPEPPVKRRHGPLSLLVHKMETEEASSAPGLSEETAHSTPGRSNEAPPLRGAEAERKMKEKKEREQQQEELERERKKTQEQEQERKRLEEEKEKERTRLEEERKQRQKEEQEKERKRREEENDRKCKEEEKRREEQRLKEEEEKKQKTVSQDRKVAKAQDSGSSSDSDSKSDSSSRSSSSSSSSSRDKTQTANQLKKADQKQDGEDGKKTNLGKGLEKQNLSKR